MPLRAWVWRTCSPSRGCTSRWWPASPSRWRARCWGARRPWPRAAIPVASPWPWPCSRPLPTPDSRASASRSAERWCCSRRRRCASGRAGRGGPCIRSRWRACGCSREIRRRCSSRASSFPFARRPGSSWPAVRPDAPHPMWPGREGCARRRPCCCGAPPSPSWPPRRWWPGTSDGSSLRAWYATWSRSRSPRWCCFRPRAWACWLWVSTGRQRSSASGSQRPRRARRWPRCGRSQRRCRRASPPDPSL